MFPKKFLLIAIILLMAGNALNAQTGNNFICLIKKNCSATDFIRQNLNVELKVGEQYILNGTSGKMLVITVKGRHYFVSEGCVTTFKINEKTPLIYDTISITTDALPVYDKQK